MQNSLFNAIDDIKFGIMAVSLDEVDVKLLTALQEDADRTNVELARLTGLSPAATLHRVRRLKESGVIRVIRAEVDPAAAGFPLQVYVTATLARHDPRSSRVFDDLIRSMPQIVMADNVAGETDYFLSVVARDVAELQNVLVALTTRGGQRLVTYLRLAEIKPPSRLPLAPVVAPARRRGARRGSRNRPGPGMRPRSHQLQRGMRIAVIGKGNIGGSLGSKWIAAGHDVIYGARDGSGQGSRRGAGNSASVTPLWFALVQQNGGNRRVALPCHPGRLKRPARYRPLLLDGAADAGHRAAAHPHLAVGVARDVDPAPAAHRRALAGHVRRGDPA